MAEVPCPSRWCLCLQVSSCSAGISAIAAQSATLAAQQVARKVFEVYMTTTAAQLNNTCTVGLTNSIVSLQPCLFCIQYGWVSSLLPFGCNV